MTLRRLLCAFPLLVVLLAACTPDQDGNTPDGTPAAGASPPAGFAARSLGPVSFATPQDWKPASTQPPPAGVQELALRAPAAPGAAAPAVVGQLQLQPPRNAAASVDSLVTIKRDVQRAQNVRSEPITLTGFTSATIVSYDEAGPGGAMLHAEALVGDVATGGLFVLNVKGTQADFDARQLSAIPRSARAG